jgi:tetrachlorobenzoquinone reductase
VDVDKTFEIVLEKSGRTLRVDADKSILETLQAAGENPNYSCGQGMCGTCETVVVAGVPDHRDLYLSADEQEAGRTIMICCSRSKTAQLVLDL